MKLQKIMAPLLGIFLLSILGNRAKANSLIVNGGFETGDFSGWNRSGNAGATGVTNTAFAGNSGAHSGNFWAYLGPVGSNGFLMQQSAIGTTIGAAYTLQLWLSSDGGTPNDFSVSFDGTSLLSLTNIPDHNWTSYTFNVVANTTSSNLTIGFRNDPSYLGLDDVSLTSSSVAVPLPKSAWAGAILLGGFGLLKLRRPMGAYPMI